MNFENIKSQGVFWPVKRRKFIKDSITTASVMLASPLLTNAANIIKPGQTYTVKQVMDLFIGEVPGGALSNTIDTLKAGSPDTIVTGIVTTMFATIEVINKAVEVSANFIIAHEPTFYNHTDDASWLQNSEVYQYKASLLKQHQIAVWRNHDYIHRLVPDGVTTGVLAQLDWQKFAGLKTPNIITIPAISLTELIGYVKQKLDIEKVRYIGNQSQKCSRILLLPGAPGGRRQIEAIMSVKPDVILCGEISEWETAEYVRDAQAKGDNLSLVVLGHIASEEPGSQYMLNWLKTKLPSLKSTHIPCGNSLLFM